MPNQFCLTFDSLAQHQYAVQYAVQYAAVQYVVQCVQQTLSSSDDQEDHGGCSSTGKLILSRIQLRTPLVVALNNTVCKS